MKLCFINDFFKLIYSFTFNHLPDAFIQSDLQMRAIQCVHNYKASSYSDHIFPQAHLILPIPNHTNLNNYLLYSIIYKL